jgi:hypothetical protein
MYLPNGWGAQIAESWDRQVGSHKPYPHAPDTPEAVTEIASQQEPG